MGGRNVGATARRPRSRRCGAAQHNTVRALVDERCGAECRVAITRGYTRQYTPRYTLGARELARATARKMRPDAVHAASLE